MNAVMEASTDLEDILILDGPIVVDFGQWVADKEILLGVRLDGIRKFF